MKKGKDHSQSTETLPCRSSIASRIANQTYDGQISASLACELTNWKPRRCVNKRHNLSVKRTCGKVFEVCVGKFYKVIFYFNSHNALVVRKCAVINHCTKYIPQLFCHTKRPVFRTRKNGACSITYYPAGGKCTVVFKYCVTIKPTGEVVPDY